MLEILMWAALTMSACALGLAWWISRESAAALRRLEDALRGDREERWSLQSKVANISVDMTDLASTVGLRRAKPAERQNAWEHKLQ